MFQDDDLFLQNLGTSLVSLAQSSKGGRQDEFVVATNQATEHLQGIIEAIAQVRLVACMEYRSVSLQACYFIGLADPSSDLGESGLIDISRLGMAQEAIKSSGAAVLNAGASEQDVKSAAASFAKSSAFLCSTSQSVADKTRNPIALKQYQAFARDLSAASTSVISCIKDIVAKKTEESRVACEKALQAVYGIVDKLATYSCSDEFANVPPSVSPLSRDRTLPVVENAHALASAVIGMISTGKDIISTPTDNSLWQVLGAHSKGVGEAVKQVVTSLKERTPGRSACEAAVVSVEELVAELDQSSGGKITMSRLDSSAQSMGEQLIPQLNKIITATQEVSGAARSSDVLLSHTVHAMLGQIKFGDCSCFACA